jgi:hypothetical protein
VLRLEQKKQKNEVIAKMKRKMKVGVRKIL